MKEIEVEVHIGYGCGGYDNRDDFYKDTVLVPNAFEKWSKERKLAWLEKNQAKIEDDIKSYVTVSIDPQWIVEELENE
jgi:hypothetical protein